MNRILAVWLQLFVGVTKPIFIENFTSIFLEMCGCDEHKMKSHTFFWLILFDCQTQ